VVAGGRGPIPEITCNGRASDPLRGIRTDSVLPLTRCLPGRMDRRGIWPSSLKIWCRRAESNRGPADYEGPPEAFRTVSLHQRAAHSARGVSQGGSPHGATAPGRHLPWTGKSDRELRPPGAGRLPGDEGAVDVLVGGSLDSPVEGPPSAARPPPGAEDRPQRLSCPSSLESLSRRRDRKLGFGRADVPGRSAAPARAGRPAAGVVAPCDARAPCHGAPGPQRAERWISTTRSR
jgi:hypothetical protein